MFEKRSKRSDARHTRTKNNSITQYLARVSALHPWRVVTAGSGLDRILRHHRRSLGICAQLRLQPHHPTGVRARKRHAARQLPASGPRRRSRHHSFESTQHRRSNLQEVRRVRQELDPRHGRRADNRQPLHGELLRGDLSGPSRGGGDAGARRHPKTGITRVLDEVDASDTDAAFAVDVAGTYTLDHDFDGSRPPT